MYGSSAVAAATAIEPKRERERSDAPDRRHYVLSPFFRPQQVPLFLTTTTTTRRRTTVLYSLFFLPTESTVASPVIIRLFTVRASEELVHIFLNLRRFIISRFFVLFCTTICKLFRKNSQYTRASTQYKNNDDKKGILWGDTSLKFAPRTLFLSAKFLPLYITSPTLALESYETSLDSTRSDSPSMSSRDNTRGWRAHCVALCFPSAKIISFS